MKERQENTRSPLSVFISYAHEDEPLCQQLETHLSLLRREGLVADWYDHQIMPGEGWAQVIDEHLETAAIILLLISADFIASDYCYDKEMTRALERHKLGEARVIPIILRPCDWQSSPFARLQSLPRDGKAITTWHNSDEAFLAIAKGLRQVIERQRIPTRPLPKVERKNRMRLIKRVQATWIEGVLEQSLHQSALIALDLQEQPDALANPWHLEVQETNLPPRLLPAGTSIVQVYDEADGELLILGEPGAGKTTLLLELTRDLLKRANDDEDYPIPVVFNLSSWAVKQQPFTEWLIEELYVKYRVPQPISQSWIENDKILPLLDGLDEVAEKARAACVEAINNHRKEHGLLPLVVCSRSTEYNDLMQTKHRLQLHSAVVIQPLTAQQIDDYLSRAGQQLEALRVALHDDPGLQELATTPLILSVLTLTYPRKSVEDLAVAGPPGLRRQQIFEAYVQRVLQHRGADTRYTRKQTMYWLTWLAQRLVQHNQTEFYIEWMQPDWLPTYRGYRVMLPVVSGLFVGLVIAFDYGLFGLFSHDLNWLGNGLGVGSVCGAMAALLSLSDRWIKPTEKLAWSWKHAQENIAKFFNFLARTLRSLRRHLTLGRLVWYLIIGIGAFNVASNPVGLVVFVILLLIMLLSIPLVVIYTGLGGVLSTEMLDKHHRILPNQGIQLSARNSLVAGSLSGLLTGLLAGLLVGLSAGLFTRDAPRLGVLVGMLLGLAVGLIFGLLRGGFACIQHVVLRLLLWHAGYIPLNYPGFLDYAAERILLRKVGGGYIFVHRLLLDYYAALEKNES